MFFARRTAVLRLTSMAAMVVSAVLTADHFHPERAFCPLAEACAAASKSELGSFFGVPTSMIGMAAFGGLFLLTLLPVEWARPLLRPAGLLAALAGLGFVAYQMYALEAFCPLCLVADGAGFVAGLITLTWPKPPIMRDGSLLPGEPIGNAMAWTLAAALVTFAPFAWPREDVPAWVEIEPMTDLAFEDDLEDGADAASDTPEVGDFPEAAPPEAAPPEAAPPEAAPPEAAPPEAAATREETGGVVLSAAAAPQAGDLAAVETPAPASDTPIVLGPPPTEAPAAVATPKAPDEAQPRKAPAPTKKRARPNGPLLVEYLNAYCPHCRKTLKRLEQVLDESGAPVRKRRVYTWGSNDYPLWARACAYAQTVGLEEQMFHQLMYARGQSRREVVAAGKRAGLDVNALQKALSQRTPPKRLVRDRALVQRARLRMLPTIDIGRRRLQGEQSSSELRDAVRAAQRQFMAQAN